MKTQAEIVAKVKRVQSDGQDFLGVMTTDLTYYLDYEHVKEFLKDGIKEEDWTTNKLSRKAVLKEMHEYIDFAWDKANNERGISASRSMQHFDMWFWLLGETTDIAFTDYTDYGKPQLKQIQDFLEANPLVTKQEA